MKRKEFLLLLLFLFVGFHLFKNYAYKVKDKHSLVTQISSRIFDFNSIKINSNLDVNDFKIIKMVDSTGFTVFNYGKYLKNINNDYGYSIFKLYYRNEFIYEFGDFKHNNWQTNDYIINVECVNDDIKAVFIIKGTDNQLSFTKKEYKFTEDEAHKLINEHFIKDLNKKDTFLLFNNRQLKLPEVNFPIKFFEETSIPMIQMQQYMPFPLFTKNYWKMNQINNVKTINYNEWSYYFKKNDSVDLKKIWNNKYDYNQTHNASFPIYNSKSKIAVLRDYPNKPYSRSCINEEYIYLYRRVDTS